MSSIYRDTYFEIKFLLQQRSNAEQLNIATWQFAADFRINADDADPAVLSTTTAGGHWQVVTEGSLTKLKFSLTPTQTADLPLGKIVGDVLRTDDVSRGNYRLFEMTIPVLDPITR